MVRYMCVDGMLMVSWVSVSLKICFFCLNILYVLGFGDHSDKKELTHMLSIKKKATDVSCGHYHTAVLTGVYYSQIF